MLKQACIGQYNTAVRYWFKGLNLSRQSVLEGAAVIVEWYEALQENRARRNTMIGNMQKVPHLLHEASFRSKGKRMTGAKRRGSGVGLAEGQKRSRKASSQSLSVLAESEDTFPHHGPIHRAASEPNLSTISHEGIYDDTALPFIGTIGKPNDMFDDECLHGSFDFL